MRSALRPLYLLLCTALYVATAAAVEEKNQYRIVLPDDIPSQSVFLDYHLAGPGGGRTVSRSHGTEDLHEFAFDIKGQVSMKAVVFCSGYKIITLDVPSLKSAPHQTVLKFEKLPVVRFTGHVLIKKDSLPDPAFLKIEYFAPWLGHFSGTNGAFSGYPKYPIGKYPVGKDGSFSCELPDCSKDPATNGSGADRLTQASLQCTLADSQDDLLADLRPQAQIATPDGVKIQSSYPEDIALSEDRSLAVEISAPVENGVGIISSEGEKPHFDVIVTNQSAVEQRIWQDWCSWGAFAFTFDLKDEKGNTWKAGCGGMNWTRNFPSFWILKPNESQKIPILFTSETWTDFPLKSNKLARRVDMRVRYRVEITRASRDLHVWTGHLGSGWQRCEFR